jgi:hypothetical protein
MESEFLSGMERNLEEAKGTLLRGSTWGLTRHDDSDAVRSLMARQRKFDRDLLSAIPQNRRVVLESYKRRWWLFGRKRVGVAVASVVSPLEWYITHGPDGGSPPPIGSSELLDHVRSLQVDPRVPHVIGVCSPTGFTAEAMRTKSEFGNVTLVLVQPSAGGGWQIVSPSESLDERVAAMFDPEDVSDKRERVVEHLRDHSAVLLTGGFSVEQVAEQTGLDPRVVAEGFERYAADDPEIHVSRQSDDMLIYRGAAAETKESFSMSMVDRIRQLFSGDGDERQKINELSQRRAALSQRRDRLYDDIVQIEKREAQLVDEGRANKSAVVRKRIAAQVAQLRKDVKRQHATAGMLNKQIDILSTDIHNLTLIQQGQMAELPNTENLTENAVRAEEMLESLQADAEMVSTLETGMTESLTSDEELAILAEFDEPSAETASEQPPARTAPDAISDASPPDAEPQRPEAEPT